MYSSFGIANEGCTLIIRPDQYVSYVGPMDDLDPLNKFFSGFKIRQGTREAAATSKGAKFSAGTNGHAVGQALSDLNGPQSAAVDMLVR